MLQLYSEISFQLCTKGKYLNIYWITQPWSMLFSCLINWDNALLKRDLKGNCWERERLLIFQLSTKLTMYVEDIANELNKR